MQIALVKNNGTDYLQVRESYQVKVDGRTVNKKRVIRNVGPLSRFDDGEPDYLKRLRDSFKNGTPIIESLSDLATATVPDAVTISFDRNNPDDCRLDPKNLGYLVLDSLYDSLGIRDVLTQRKSDSKIEYDLNGIVKLLLFGRALDPDSKKSTFGQRDGYAFKVVDDCGLAEVYRALDVLDEVSEALQTRMNTRISKTVGRNMELCYYDVTNYWFEIGENDGDELDDDGNVVKSGLRKKGVSKEKRPEPIVQMGLFMDDNGIPVSYRLFPGNNVDQTTLRPALRAGPEKMGFGRYVVVADAGLNSGKNAARVVADGNGYILAKGTRKCNKGERAWILDPDGYEANASGTFKVKSRTGARSRTRTATRRR